MPTFHTVEHDDFGSWVGLCRNKSTVGNSTEVIINNPFSTNNVSEPTLQNYIDVNTGLTPIHSCHVAQDDSKRIIRDSHNNILNGADRGPMDEMVLMGRLVQDSTGKTNFTYAIDDSGTPCDGFAQIIQPSWGTWSGSTNASQSLADHDQFSMRTNLQFADLDPFTWVPVFGVTYGAATRASTNALAHFDNNLAYPGSTIDYRNETANYGYARPDGLSSSASNLYGISWGNELGTGYMDASHTWYMLYCHDGSGNGMLASCLGMSATGMKYMLNTGNGSYAAKDMCASNAHWDTHHGKFKYVPPTVLQTLFTTHGNNLQTIWDHYGTNAHGGGRRIVQPSTTSTSGGGSNADPLYNGRHQIWGNISLIAYGPTANPTLSSPENIYVNHVKLRSPSSEGHRINRFGAYDDNTADTYNTYYARYVTGKVGDLIFYNHPTMWSGGYDTENSWYVAPTCSRFILHATHLGKCKINDFSIGAYTPVTASMRKATSGVLNSYYMPYSNMEYIFPGTGVTYNPVAELSSSSSFIDTGSSWTAEINMFDATPDTYTTVTDIGTSNALHIPLNGVSSGNTVPNNLDPVEEFSINIRGIKQQDIKEYEIVFALTDSDRVTLVTATENQRVSVTESAGGTIDTSTKYPLSESAYTVTFKASDASIKYGDIKDGYLKMYVVEKTNTNAP